MNASEFISISPELVAIGDKAALEQIDLPDMSLCIWRRCLPADVAAEASSLLDEPFDAYAMVHQPFRGGPVFDEAPAVIRRRIGTAARLLHDAAMLARLFMRAARASAARLRLECLHDDGCALFHADNVGLRLATAYAGAGLQWVKPACNDAAKREQREYRGPIEQVMTGDVALLKGKRATRAPILHRSPPIRLSGPRLILIIDEADQNEEFRPIGEAAPCPVNTGSSLRLLAGASRARGGARASATSLSHVGLGSVAAG